MATVVAKSIAANGSAHHRTRAIRARVRSGWVARHRAGRSVGSPEPSSEISMVAVCANTVATRLPIASVAGARLLSMRLMKHLARHAVLRTLAATELSDNPRDGRLIQTAKWDKTTIALPLDRHPTRFSGTLVRKKYIQEDSQKIADGFMTRPVGFLYARWPSGLFGGESARRVSRR